MPLLPEQIRRFAEEPDEFVPDPAPPARRIRTPSFVLMLTAASTMSTVSQIRTSEDELEETIEHTRRLAMQSGYKRLTWFVGPSCTPAALAELLRERGFAPATPPLELSLTAMALVKPPTSPPDGIEVRLVADFDEYETAYRIVFDVFNVSEEMKARMQAALPELWRHSDFVNRFTHLALVEGKPVGFSFTVVGTIGLVLNGSGVLPEARGRGVYRALVAARWAEAVKREKPALVIQAGSMSGPILERCGFEPICQLDLLDDPAFALTTE